MELKRSLDNGPKGSLKSQRQIWDILRGVSSLGVWVQQKSFSLVWQVVFKLGYVFCQER